MTDGMTTWRVMTWNLHGSARPDLTLIAQAVGRATPDVVALQEVRRSQAMGLAARLGWEHEWVFKHNGYWPLWWRAEGLAIMWLHLSPELRLLRGYAPFDALTKPAG